MKVLLTQDVPGLGTAGQVKEVTTGYARNYLIPKGLAVAAAPGTMRMVETQRKAQAEREARLAARAAELAERMAATTLTFQAKAGPTGRLYGSVTPADIAEALERELGVRLERRKIQSDPLREVGEYTIPVRLSGAVEARVRVVVQAEGAGPLVEDAPDTAG